MNKINIELVNDAGNYVVHLLADNLPDSNTGKHAKYVIDSSCSNLMGIF